LRIGRTVPPASAPLGLTEILNGLRGLGRGSREVERFRSELMSFFEVRHCFLVSSGKAALTLILQALHDRHPRRREVLIPAFACYSLPSAIRRAGLVPRLCDVDPRTLDYDERHLGRSLSAVRLEAGGAGSGLLAAVSVHLFGRPVDTARLRSAIPDPDVAVIEDAAQAMGARGGGRRVGLEGDVGFFSLGRGKAWTTGEGGIIVTRRDEIAAAIGKRVAQLPGYGMGALAALALRVAALSLLQRPAFFWIPRLIPFLRVGDTIYDPSFPMRRFSAFQAGLARGWQARLDAFRRRRRQSVLYWERMPLPDGLTRCGGAAEGAPIDFIRYPLRIVRPRLWREILARSQAQGLGIMLTYPGSIDEIPELKGELKGQDFPAARRLSQEILTLPVHPLLTDRDRSHIAALMRAVGEADYAGKAPASNGHHPLRNCRGPS
jgi:dTDP-4-amino-4,6-dideoxygalactose transaminase